MAKSKAQRPTSDVQKPNQGLRTFGLFLIPVILLAAVIALFLQTGGGLSFESPVPIEDLTVERVIFSGPPENVYHIEVIVRNNSPEPVTIAQVIVNEGVRPFTMEPSFTIPRLGTASVGIDYGWVEGEAYSVTLFTTNAIAFTAEIPVAFKTPQTNTGNLLGFTLIGLYVGVIPVFLGIFWLPALRRLGHGAMTFLMALTAGLLVFLGVDTLVEAIEQTASVPNPFQGFGLIAIGSVGIFMLLAAISAREANLRRSEGAKRLAVAYMIALGIGLHNLGEGLAIGTAYNVGEIALGTFLVIGFIIQNITEGLGIIAPILREKTPVRDLLLLGLLGGAPAIAGTWLGALSPNATMAVLFLGIGAGAIFEVIYEIAKLLQRDTEKRPAPMLIFSGVLVGMLLLWVTGLLVK
ncbi:MAG TPA: ZIP family metal transporter [Anaerolineales bacterium]|jgi:zinc transporter ZupT|nr:ZIP family metal transporter [Anaerolineales bacterium]